MIIICISNDFGYALESLHHRCKLVCCCSIAISLCPLGASGMRKWGGRSIWVVFLLFSLQYLEVSAVLLITICELVVPSSESRSESDPLHLDTGRLTETKTSVAVLIDLDCHCMCSDELSFLLCFYRFLFELFNSAKYSTISGFTLKLVAIVQSEELLFRWL